jgi:hypothetical protein
MRSMHGYVRQTRYFWTELRVARFGSRCHLIWINPRLRIGRNVRGMNDVQIWRRGDKLLIDNGNIREISLRLVTRSKELRQDSNRVIAVGRTLRGLADQPTQADIRTNPPVQAPVVAG